MGPLVLERSHQFIGGIEPDMAERSLAYITERIVAPELVGMDRAIPANAADPVAGAITLVHQ